MNAAANEVLRSLRAEIGDGACLHEVFGVRDEGDARPRAEDDGRWSGDDGLRREFDDRWVQVAVLNGGVDELPRQFVALWAELARMK